MIELRQPNIDDAASERQAYNEIYAGRGLEQSDSFYLWLLDLLEVEPDQTLLDVSCGQGKLVQFARNCGLSPIGVDLSETALHTAADMTQSGLFAAADAQLLPLPNRSFDIVTNIGSIEHYLDPAQGIREMARVLRPGGTACILVPNAYSLLGNIKHVLQTGDVYQGPQPIERYNTLKGWKRLLQANGLRPFKTAKFERVVPRTFQDLLWHVARPSKAVHLLLTGLIPLPLVDHFAYLCHPDHALLDAMKAER